MVSIRLVEQARDDSLKVSRRWQKKQNVILHTSLAALWGGSLFWLELSLPPWQELLLIALTVALVFLVGRYLHGKFADSLVKVFKVEYGVTSRAVQRALNGRNIPFFKRTYGQEVVFNIRGRGLTLVVESFPLNLPVDDHIKPTTASKITVRGLTQTNAQLGHELCQAIDDIFARHR